MASGNFHAADSYSSFTYWRDPLPDIEIDMGAVTGDAASGATASVTPPTATQSDTSKS